MYEQCESCKVPLCHHNQGVREKMIRPNNFTLEAKGDLEASLLKDIANYEKLKANGFKKKSKSKEDK
jgi:hypothetical protein